MADEEKPKATFLSAQDPDTWDKPDDVSWGDYSFKPGKPLTPKAKRLCHLIAGGMTQTEAAEHVGYSQGWASRIMTSQKGREEIQKYQEKMFERSIPDRVKDLGTNAMDVIEEILTSDDVNIKPQLRADIARWVAEKISGKPKQEVEHSGNVLHEFMDRVQQLEESGQVLDVTPTANMFPEVTEGDEKKEKATERSKLDQFLDLEASDLE